MRKYLSGNLFGVLTQSAFWIVLLIFILSLSSAILPWPESFYRSALIVVCHLLNFYFFYSFLVPRFFETGRYFPAAIIFFISLLVLTPLRIGVENLFQAQATSLHVLTGPNARISFLIISQVTIAAFASLLRLAVNHTRMKVRMTELEKNQLETELRFLKGQMSPHFLFNSINNIYSLVLTKSNQAPDALLKLSSLLRYLLYECDQKVSIEKEVHALKTYADLFQLKFKDPLRIDWKIEIEDASRMIEPLLLVPVFENAVKHSGLGVEEHAEIKLSIHSNAERLVIETSNSICKLPPKQDIGGIGLVNIRRRLERLFPDLHQLTIKETENRFLLYLEMPLL